MLVLLRAFLPHLHPLACIADCGSPTPTLRCRLWRRSWRDKILPALANFKPDIIFVCAGAHSLYGAMRWGAAGCLSWRKLLCIATSFTFFHHRCVDVLMTVGTPACSMPPAIPCASAGFDAHKKDEINFRYIGVTERDYEWLTEQLVAVANRCAAAWLAGAAL